METFNRQTLRDRILGGVIHGGPAAMYHVVAALRPSLESYLKAPWPDTWTRTPGLTPSRSTQFATATMREIVQGDSGNAIYFVALCASIAAVGGVAMVNVRTRWLIPPPNPSPSKDPLPSSPDPSRGGTNDVSDSNDGGRPDNPEDPPLPPPPLPPAIDPDPVLGPSKDFSVLYLLLCIALCITQKRGEHNAQVLPSMDISATSTRMHTLRPSLDPIFATSIPSIPDTSQIISHTVYDPTKIGGALPSHLGQIICIMFLLILIKHSVCAFKSTDNNKNNRQDAAIEQDTINQNALAKQRIRTFNTLMLAVHAPPDDPFLIDPPDRPGAEIDGHSPPTPEYGFEVFETESATAQAIADHEEDISLVEADYDPGAHARYGIYNAPGFDNTHDPHLRGEWYSWNNTSDNSGTPNLQDDSEGDVRDELQNNTNYRLDHTPPNGLQVSSPNLNIEHSDTIPLSDSELDGPNDTDSLDPLPNAVEVEAFADIEDNDDDYISSIDYDSPMPALSQDWETILNTFDLFYSYPSDHASTSNANPFSEAEDASLEDTSHDNDDNDDEFLTSSPRVTGIEGEYHDDAYHNPAHAETTPSGSAPTEGANYNESSQLCDPPALAHGLDCIFNHTFPLSNVETTTSAGNADSLGPLREAVEVEDAFTDIENSNDDENQSETPILGAIHDDHRSDGNEYHYDPAPVEVQLGVGALNSGAISSPAQNTTNSDDEFLTSPETQGFTSDTYSTSVWDPDGYRIEREEALGAEDYMDTLHADEVVWHFVPEDFDDLAPIINILVDGL